MDRTSKFWDRMARRYAAMAVADEEAYQRKLKLTREHLQPDMAVFEFGCGTGSTALAHAPYVKRILATDYSEKMIEIAREKAEAAGVANVSFEQASIAEIGAPDASFDAALGLNILHLLDDPDAAIAKVRRLLKPGGVFVTNTVCIKDMSGFKVGLMRMILPIGGALGLLPKINALSKADLLQSLTTGGFEIDQEWTPGPNKGVFIIARKR